MVETNPTEAQTSAIEWGNPRIHIEDGLIDVEATIESWSQIFLGSIEKTIDKEGKAGVIGLHEMHEAQREVDQIKSLLNRNPKAELNAARVGLISRGAAAAARIDVVRRCMKYEDTGYTPELVATYNSMKAHIESLDGVDTNTNIRMVLEKMRFQVNTRS